MGINGSCFLFVLSLFFLSNLLFGILKLQQEGSSFFPFSSSEYITFLLKMFMRFLAYGWHYASPTRHYPTRYFINHPCNILQLTCSGPYVPSPAFRLNLHSPNWLWPGLAPKSTQIYPFRSPTFLDLFDTNLCLDVYMVPINKKQVRTETHRFEV